MKVQDYKSGDHPIQTGRFRLSRASNGCLNIGIVIAIRVQNELRYSLHTLRRNELIRYEIPQGDWY